MTLDLFVSAMTLCVVCEKKIIGGGVGEREKLTHRERSKKRERERQGKREDGVLDCLCVRVDERKK
jgi:hypothetical protein